MGFLLTSCFIFNQTAQLNWGKASKNEDIYACSLFFQWNFHSCRLIVFVKVFCKMKLNIVYQRAYKTFTLLMKRLLAVLCTSFSRKRIFNKSRQPITNIYVTELFNNCHFSAEKISSSSLLHIEAYIHEVLALTHIPLRSPYQRSQKMLNIFPGEAIDMLYTGPLTQNLNFSKDSIIKYV